MKKLKLLIVRFLLLSLCLFSCSVAAFGQITLSVRNQPIRSILKQIEKSSDYGFFYSNALPDIDTKKSITVNNASISQTLDKLFEGTRISYNVVENYKQINLTSKVTVAEKPQPAQTQAAEQQKTERVITGVVTDEDSDPMLGVVVQQKGSASAVTTNLNGAYSLTIAEGASDVLTFEYLGYQTASINFTPADTKIDVSLKSETRVIEDIVVIGYGTQKKVNLTGAVASLVVDDALNDKPVSNISTSLSGLIPGLAVAQSSGEAGNNSAELLIRGMGTINNAEPLIVVDGLPGMTLDRLNMEDVESISVLKDAAAASVYGARGANGVILITTKTGKNANQTQVKFTASYAVSEPTNTFHFMTDYARAMYLQQRKAGVSLMLSDLPFKDGTIDNYLALQMIDPVNYPNTDWWNLISRNGIMKKYNISATGGSEYSNFYASMGVQEEQGQRLNNDHIRYNARFNYDYKVKKNINIGVRFDGSWTETTSASTGDMWSAIAGIYPYDEETGRYGGPMAYGETVEVNNPLAMLNSTKTYKNRQEANASAYIDYSPVKGLKATVDYIIHYQNAFSSYAPMPTGAAWNFQTDEPTELVFVPASAGISNNTSTGWKSQLSARLDYNTKIGKYQNISAMALYNEESNFSRSLGASREERIDPSLSEINAALNNIQTTSGTSARSGLRSFVGRVNYSAFDRYLLEINARYDGYSRFTRGHQWGLFPSVSAGWRFSEEPLLSSAKEWLDNGKFRVSYGSLGNNTGVENYQQLNTLTSTKYYEDGQVVSGFTSTKLINEDLTWEKTTIFNVGIDLGFLHNRLTFEADYYNRLTTGMIQSSDASLIVSGLATPKKNMGSLLNRGVELNINWHDGNKIFRYSVNFNIGYNASQLLSWNEYLSTGTIWIGMPYNFTYMYHDAGKIAQTWFDTYQEAPQSKFPGDLLLKDVNGDGQVNRYDMVAYPQYNQDRPTTNYGLNTSFSYKGLSLTVQLQGTYGRMANWRTSYNNFNFPNTGYATTWEHWFNTWTIDNRNGGWPRAGGGQATANMETTNYWMDDLSYLRVKNLQLSYSLPSRLTKRIGLGMMRFYVSGTNLLTFTKFRGLDPEKSDLNDLYPLNKTFSFGININI